MKAIDERVEDARITLVRHTQVIANATTNRFGEFQLEFDGAGDVDVFLALALDSTSILFSLER